MRAFVGVVRFDPFPDVERDKHELIRRTHADKRVFATEESDHAVFMQMGEPAGSEQGAWRAPGTLFAGRAFLHNADDLSRQLDLPPGMGDAAIAGSALQARGDAGLAMLLGNFALARWDERRRELTLARDYGSGDSLFFYRGKNFVVFASHLPELLAHPDVPRQLDDVVLASFLAGNRQQKRRTVFQGIERVPTRSVVTITADKTAHRTYWSPEFRTVPLYARDQDYIERARELLDRAVARVLKDSPRFAVMASGGLDSSAVVSTLARQGHSTVPCYTFIPAEGGNAFVRENEYPSERPKTELLARTYPALQFRYIRTQDLRQFERSDERYFDGWPIPMFAASVAQLFVPLYDAMAADGVKVVLMGTAGNLGLTWDGFNLLPELARQGHIVTLLREAKATASLSGTPILRVLVHELLYPSLPVWAGQTILRLLGHRPYLDRSDVAMDSSIPLRPELISELDLPRVFQEDGAIRPASLRRRTRQDRAERMFGFAYLMHEARALVEGRYGIEVRDPMADRDLLEFSLNVPERLYRRDGLTRRFARAVLADRVPAEILGEKRLGAQATNWFSAMSVRRHELAAEVERMEASLTACRMFDVPRLKRLLDDWPKDAAEAERLRPAYIHSLAEAVHVFRFMRWVNRGNA